MHKIIRAMATACDSDVRAAYIARMAGSKGRRQRLEETMAAAGFERVDAAGPLTADGREVVSIGGVAWALRPEVHAARLAAAFAAAKQPPSRPEPDTKSVAGSDSLSVMVCPKCGDSLQQTAVCPKCAAGKLGYRHRYTCVCGGVDLVSKDKL